MLLKLSHENFSEQLITAFNDLASVQPPDVDALPISPTSQQDPSLRSIHGWQRLVQCKLSCNMRNNSRIDIISSTPPPLEGWLRMVQLKTRLHLKKCQGMTAATASVQCTLRSKLPTYNLNYQRGTETAAETKLSLSPNPNSKSEPINVRL